MDQSVASSASSRTFWTTDDIRHKVESAKVVVFAKGNTFKPGCGYSERALNALQDCGRPFEVVDVREDRSILAALRVFAGRCSLPLVFVNGDLVSTSEELKEVVESGELKDRIEKAFS